MIKLAILVAVCVVGSMAISCPPVLDKPYYDVENAEDLFSDFVIQHGKSYNRREYFERLEIFKKTLITINRQNAEHPKTVFAVNRFADLKPEELEQYRGFRPANTTGVKVASVSPLSLPSSYDWREYNVVTHVKNQGGCGSCFIFSAIGNIEGQYAIKHKQSIALSEGQALDCLPSGSCQGGWPDNIMKQFASRAGVMREGDYPYSPIKRPCHENPSQAVVRVTSGQHFAIADEDTLAATLVKTGPLSIGIDSEYWMNYQSGVLQLDQCGSIVDHAVLLVGYGQDACTGDKYWIIKNSWGTDWGESGYLRLIRGVRACSILKYTATSTVA